VFAARRIHCPAIACALARALLASAMSGTAAARPNQRTQVSAALAKERYYSSHRAPQTIDASTPAAQRQDLRSPDAHDAAALASRGVEAPAPDTATTDADRIAALSCERMAAAYGEPAPLTAPQPPAPSDDTPWLAIALSIAVALTIAAASATQLRRLRIRRRPSQELAAPDHWRPPRPPRRAPYPRPSHPHPPRRNGAPSHRSIATVLGGSHARLSPLRRQGHAHDLPVVPQAGRDRRSLHAAVDRWPRRAARAYRDPLPLRANERASPLGRPRHLLGTEAVAQTPRPSGPAKTIPSWLRTSSDVIVSRSF
jgi:hypothetical protein